jgi:hypothetical protein
MGPLPRRSGIRCDVAHDVAVTLEEKSRCVDGVESRVYLEIAAIIAHVNQSPREPSVQRSEQSHQDEALGRAMRQSLELMNRFKQR